MFFTIGVLGVLLFAMLWLADAVFSFLFFVALVRDYEANAVSRRAGWAGLILSAGTPYSFVHVLMLKSVGVRTGVFATVVSLYVTVIGSIASCFFYKGDGKWFLRSATAIGCFLACVVVVDSPVAW